MNDFVSLVLIEMLSANRDSLWLPINLYAAFMVDRGIAVPEKRQ